MPGCAPPPGPGGTGPGADAGSRFYDKSVSGEFRLGLGSFGVDSGYLIIHEPIPTNRLCGPQCLQYYSTNGEAQVIGDGSGNIRQVKTPQGLIDVVTLTGTKFSLNYYLPVNVGAIVGGVYTVSGFPYYTNAVENPDGTSSTNRHRFTDSNGYVYDYEWKTNGWQLTTGSGLRQEYHTEWTTNSGNIKFVQTDLFNAAYSLVDRNRKQFTNASGAWRLIEEIRGAGSDARTNTFVPGPGVGLVTRELFAKGEWTYREFDSGARPTNELSGYGLQGYTTNPALCRQLQHDYSTNVVSGSGDDLTRSGKTPRRTIELLLGQEISRSYTVVLSNEVAAPSLATAPSLDDANAKAS